MTIHIYLYTYEYSSDGDVTMNDLGFLLFSYLIISFFSSAS